MGQDISSTPSVSIGDHTLEVVDKFTYPMSTISSNLSLDEELNSRIGKAATAMARLTKRMWDNKMLSTNIKMGVYQACVLRNLLYGSEAWTLYSRQERRLNAFNLRCLRRLLDITWKDSIANMNVLDKAGLPSIYAILTQRRLRWLSHVISMEDGCITNDMLFGELAIGSGPTGHSALCYKATAGPLPDTRTRTEASRHLQHLQQAMQFPHRPIQPHPALQFYLLHIHHYIKYKAINIL